MKDQLVSNFEIKIRVKYSALRSKIGLCFVFFEASDEVIIGFLLIYITGQVLKLQRRIHFIAPHTASLSMMIV